MKEFIKAIIEPFSGAAELKLEKARLEAFLSAVQGEYCGFASDGSVIFSPGFCSLLNLPKIDSIHDIQNQLSTSDSAVLEGQFYQLEQDGKSFSVTARSADEKKIFRLSGSRGEDLDGQDSFHILWLEDVTAEKEELESLKKEQVHRLEELEKLQSTLDSLPMPLWMRGPDASLTWCNNAYAVAVGEAPAAVIAKQKEIPLSSKSKVKPPKEMAKAALKEGSAQEMKAHVILGGQRKYMAFSERPLPSTDHTVGMAVDITREEELDTEMQRYLAANKELLEQLRTAIAIYGPDQKLEFYNSAFSQLWGLEDQWLNGGPKLGNVLEKLRESRRLPEQADFRKYKEGWLNMFTRLIEPHEDMLYLPDSTALRMLVVPHPMGGLMMTFEDVTSRLELESSYNTLIAVQKETLDNLAEGVAVYGGDGRLKLWNPAFAELWKLHPEDLDGQPHISRLTDKMAPLFNKESWPETKEDLLSHGLERSIREGHLSRTDDMLLEYATVPLPDGGVLVSYFDVTDTAKVENALREKNAALEAAEQLKLDFLANVSYQLRTPLSTIMGFSEILEKQYFGDLNERQSEYASGIQAAGQSLLSLIDDILDLSTIEAGYMDLNIEEFSIKEMLQGLYALTQEWARKQKIEVKLECPGNIGKMPADERRMKQVLLNLIRNAINHTPENGIIILRASRKKEHVELAVIDTGIGIPQSALKRIFEPFERVAGSRAEKSGSNNRGAGLGLTLVKNIIELHGGEIDIQSQENEGTSVTLKMPLKVKALAKAD